MRVDQERLSPVDCRGKFTAIHTKWPGNGPFVGGRSLLREYALDAPELLKDMPALAKAPPHITWTLRGAGESCSTLGIRGAEWAGIQRYGSLLLQPLSRGIRSSGPF